MKRYITEKNLTAYQEYLYEEEKSPATIQKYMRDLRKLASWMGQQEITKKKIIEYIEKKGIKHGIVFQTAGGRPVDRSNVWKEMKALCKLAGVREAKVFPHNLRHLFAKSFYKIDKDIARLADVLGHSNIETTRIYIKTTGYEHQRQLEHMGLVLRANKNAT